MSYVPTPEELKELGFDNVGYSESFRIRYLDGAGFYIPEDVPNVYPKSFEELRLLISMMTP